MLAGLLGVCLCGSAPGRALALSLRAPSPATSLALTATAPAPLLPDPPARPGALRRAPAPSPGTVHVYRAPERPAPPPPALPRLQYPLDLALQGRFVPEYAPFYLPEAYPAASAESMVAEAYYRSPLLRQGREEGANPYLVKRAEVQRLYSYPDRFLERALGVAALAWLWRDYQVPPETYLTAALSRSRDVNHEVLAQTVIPPLVAFLPPVLTQVERGPGLVPVDLAVHAPSSTDSLAPPEVMLRTAAQRGLRAVVVVSRGRLDGAQQAQRTAERLRRRGLLPPDFQVLPGEVITTTTGPVVGLFLRERVPEGMTIAATVRAIHQQGGLAYMARPGALGGPRLLRDLPFDGYFIRHGFREMFRTLEMLYDPRLEGKTALYASHSHFAAGVGLPYSTIVAESTEPQALHEALRTQQAYAAGGLYMPYMAAITIRPIGAILRFINTLFEGHDHAELLLTRLLHSDNVQIYTSWDKEIGRWLDLWGLPGGLHDLIRSRSPLTGVPEVLEISADYGPVRARYELERKRLSLGSVLTW